MDANHHATSEVHTDSAISGGDVQGPTSCSQSSISLENPPGGPAIHAQTNFRVMDDPSNPHDLHYGESTDTQLIFVNLSDENYSTWSRAVTIALSENKEGSSMTQSLSQISIIYYMFHGEDVIMWCLRG